MNAAMTRANMAIRKLRTMPISTLEELAAAIVVTNTLKSALNTLYDQVYEANDRNGIINKESDHFRVTE